MTEPQCFDEVPTSCCGTGTYKNKYALENPYTLTGIMAQHIQDEE